MLKKFIYALWGMLAVGLIAVFLVFYSITKGWVGFVPPVEELENPNYKFATQIISSDGKLLSTYSYSRENRVWTDYDDLSQGLIDALISIDYACNIVVIKTHAGLANALAVGIDSMHLDTVLGCVAGDDTILIVSRSENDACYIADRIREMIK